MASWWSFAVKQRGKQEIGILDSARLPKAIYAHYAYSPLIIHTQERMVYIHTDGLCTGKQPRIMRKQERWRKCFVRCFIHQDMSLSGCSHVLSGMLPCPFCSFSAVDEV